MSNIDISECPSEGPEFEAVLLLLKQAKQTVGFLPDSAVRDRAERGTLLIAAELDAVVGYVLYDLPRSEVRIVQLVVAKSMRRAGIARLLVEEVVSRNPARRGIVLECRRDFSARDAWPRLGFIPLAERPGRGHEGRTLTVWWRDFGHPTLFSYLANDDERPIAALDANVVIDLSEGANTTSRHLGADWVSSACRLAVTDEVYVEIERHDDAEVRVRHKTTAAGLEQLSCTPVTWRPFEAALEAHLGDRANSYAADVRHAAKAAAGRARWFVTRDDKFRKACAAEVLQAWDLLLVSPTAFVLELDRLVRGELYRPADLAGSDIQIRPLAPHELDQAARTFVNQRDGERLRDLRSRLNGLAAEPQTTRVTVFADRTGLLALAATVSGAPEELAIGRVRHGRTQETVARHMLGWVRTDAVRLPGGVKLTDPYCGQVVVRATAEEGFLDSPGGRIAFAVDGVGTRQMLRDQLADLVEGLPTDSVPPGILDRVAATPAAPTAAMSLEATFHPYSVIGAGLPTFMVPIKRAWAAELVDPGLSRAQLFARSTGLALQREHVYYRSPRSSGGLTAPARILWYVSGSGAGGRTIRAISHLEEIAVGDPVRLHRRFAHLGVYTEAQVRGAAVAGRVMALRFARTRTIEPAVALEDYRHVVARHRPGAGVAMVGPQPVAEQVFVSLATMRS